MSYIYRPQRSWGKVIFSEACVKNSVHRGEGGCAPLHAGIHPPKGPEADTPQSRHPPPQEKCMLGYTGNKRAVRILLEYILVYYYKFLVIHVNVTILVRQEKYNIETFTVTIDQNYTRRIQSNYEKTQTGTNCDVRTDPHNLFVSVMIIDNHGIIILFWVKSNYLSK